MKKQLLSIVLFAAGLIMQAQQVLNPGFESWTGSFATNWGSTSEALVNNGKANPHLEVQTTTAHTGSYAMLMQNQNLLIAGGNNAPGTVCTCPIVFSGGPILGFNPYSSMPLSYDFWYEFNAVGGDNARTQLYLTKWNTSNNKRDTLATANSLITGPVSSYTQMTVPITWLNTGQTPDSMQLSFTSSVKLIGGGVPTGGMLYIDDVNFNLTATGIENIHNSTLVNIYPNPSNGNFIIETNSTTKQNVQVYDVNGRVVLTQFIIGKTTIDASGLPSGIYNVSIISNEGVANKRLVIAK